MRTKKIEEQMTIKIENSKQIVDAKLENFLSQKPKCDQK